MPGFRTSRIRGGRQLGGDAPSGFSEIPIAVLEASNGSRLQFSDGCPIRINFPLSYLETSNDQQLVFSDGSPIYVYAD